MISLSKEQDVPMQHHSYYGLEPVGEYNIKPAMQASHRAHGYLPISTVARGYVYKPGLVTLYSS